MNYPSSNFKVLCPGTTIKDIGPSLFLAGPTPRSGDAVSWRPEALQILSELDFSGTILVPEREDWVVSFDYNEQIEWELRGLNKCSLIVFWVPRKIPEMMGLTTNVEFGMHIASGKILYGRPDGATQTRYLDKLCQDRGKTVYNNLHDLLKQAVKEVG